MTNSELVRVAVFEGKHIRKIIHADEWWFSVIDIVEVLTGSDRPRKYWNDLKKKLAMEGYVEVSEKIGQLKMLAPDGKMRATDCANTGETEITKFAMDQFIGGRSDIYTMCPMCTL